MAKKNKNKSGRSKMSWLALFSYIAVMLLGLSLAITLVVTKVIPESASLAQKISKIAIGISLIPVMVLSYRESRKQKQVWFILWVISVVLVAVFYVWLAIIG